MDIIRRYLQGRKSFGVSSLYLTGTDFASVGGADISKYLRPAAACSPAGASGNMRTLMRFHPHGEDVQFTPVFPFQLSKVCSNRRPSTECERTTAVTTRYVSGW